MLALDRRKFMGMAGAAAMVSPFGASAMTAVPELTPIGAKAVPISVAEREARIARVQKLMREQGLSAILIEPGSSLLYFTGVRWGRSERLTGAVIPAEGRIGVFTPFFEEPSVRESLAVPRISRPGTSMRIRSSWSAAG
jgi:Xaa-Pro dipeptidase